MRVSVQWTLLERGDRRWRGSRCLYAYVDKQTKRPLYLGKAYSATILERLEGRHKAGIFGRLAEKFGMSQHWVPEVLHGRLVAESGRRVTKPVFRDVESLLIKRLDPHANIRCKGSRIERRGLVVECIGDWPFRRRRFRDAREIPEIAERPISQGNCGQ